MLQEDVGRSHRTDEASNVGPQPPLVGRPAALAGGGMRLAGEAGREDRNAASKLLAWEGGEVVPDRRLIQGRIRHARAKERGGIGFPFAVSDGAVGVAEGQSEAEFESAAAGAQGQAGDAGRPRGAEGR